MTEMVSSAIVGEAVSRIFSGIACTSKEENNSTEEAVVGGGGLERLEMARIKMEAALDTSNRWQITDASLLHWRKKLKRAAQDCDDAARRCRRLSREEDEAEQVVRKSSFPRRIAQAAKAFISSFGGRHSDRCSEGSVTATSIRRFERLADGASQFMRFVQLGGTPRQHLFFDPLISHLFAGKSLLYRVLQPGGHFNLFGIRPMGFEERGLEAILSFTHRDPMVPNNNFRLRIMLRLSESTDIIGTTVKCLRRVTPHFKSTADIVIKEITRLPTQDFTCVPRDVANAHLDHWNDIHTTLTRWFRPDPVCCQGYDVVPSYGDGGSGNKLRHSSLLPEPVCHVFLQRQISQHEYNRLLPGSSAATSSSLENFPPLRLGILFMPHQSFEDPDSTSEGSTIEAIDGEKQDRTYANVHLDQLDEMLLPKAIGYLHHNTNATNYQICWISDHGSAHLYVENTRIPGACICIRISGRVIYKMLRQKQPDQRLRKVQLEQVARDLLKLWVVCSSERLRTLFSAWIQ